jgi:YggT family protein
MIPCQLYAAADWLLNVYMLVMLVYALVSWVPSIRGKWTEYVAMLVEPVLTPVRRIIPPIGGLDLSFLVVIVLIQLVIGVSRQYAC